MYAWGVDLVGELDKWFSLFTRLRFADWKGDVLCYTCTWRGHWKECDAGHFNKRGNLSTRFDENNARPQCRDCNRHRDGMQEVFEEELRDEVGDEEVDRILQGKYEEAHYTTEWFEEKIRVYKSFVKQRESSL